jgi:hypothetical protein
MATKIRIRTVIGFVALFGLITAAAATSPALACAPEVKFDPETGIALPNPELDAALREINAHRNVADAR